MGTVLKIILWFIGVVVLVFVLAAVALTLVFDPNDYKDQIERIVQDKTGRELEIKGDIKLSFFPWLGVEVGRVNFGNAPGYPAPHFASAERIEVGVRLLPLIDRQVQTSTVTLRGLVLHLTRSKDEKGNWEDLMALAKQHPDVTLPEPIKTPPAQPTETKPEVPLVSALTIGGLDIQDARVEWNDEVAGQRYTLNDLSLQTGAIVPGEPTELEMKFQVEGGSPPVAADLTLTGELDRNLSSQVYRMRSLNLTGNLTGQTVPSGEMDVAMGADVNLDLSRQALSVSDLRLDTLGMKLTGVVSGENLLTQPGFKGTLTVAPFNARQLLQRLGETAPKTADSGVLGEASLKTDFTASTTSVSLEPFTAQLDDTTITGSLTVPDVSGPVIRFDLTANGIDLDRYMPPPAESVPANPTGEPVATGTRPIHTETGNEPSLQPLRQLDMEGRLRIGNVKVNNLTLSDLALPVKVKDGMLRLNPVEARLYDGRFKGNMGLDATRQEPRITLNHAVTGLQVGPLLRDLRDQDWLVGTANASANLAMRGTTEQAIRRSLNGTAQFSFADGAVKGINIGRLIREASARLTGTSLPPDKEPLQTDFTEMSATVDVTDGVAKNNDLLAKSPLLRVTGRGSANLVTERLDYVLTTMVVDTPEGQGGKEIKALQGVAIPIKITGSFDHPNVALDVESIVKARAEALVEEKTKELGEKIEEKLNKELQEKLPSEAQELLKKLF